MKKEEEEEEKKIFCSRTNTTGILYKLFAVIIPSLLLLTQRNIEGGGGEVRLGKFIYTSDQTTDDDKSGRALPVDTAAAVHGRLQVADRRGAGIRTPPHTQTGVSVSSALVARKGWTPRGDRVPHPPACTTSQSLSLLRKLGLRSTLHPRASILPPRPRRPPTRLPTS